MKAHSWVAQESRTFNVKGGSSERKWLEWPSSGRLQSWNSPPTLESQMVQDQSRPKERSQLPFFSHLMAIFSSFSSLPVVSSPSLLLSFLPVFATSRLFTNLIQPPLPLWFYSGFPVHPPPNAHHLFTSALHYFRQPWHLISLGTGAGQQCRKMMMIMVVVMKVMMMVMMMMMVVVMNDDDGGDDDGDDGDEWWWWWW